MIKRETSMESSKAGTNEKSPDGLSLPNQNIMLINYMVLFQKIEKKYNEIQLTKKKKNWNNGKITNHPPSPWTNYLAT